MSFKRTAVAAFAALSFVAATWQTAAAQTYPTRPIRLIVPAGPGGPTDVIARVFADRMTSALGQSVIVENRAGGGGAIGAKVVAASDPDGYTLLLGNTATLANIPAMSKSAGYDPVKSFTPVAKLVDSYQVLVVRPDFPAKTVADLVVYAKANPGKLNYATAGVGNITHLSGELLKAKAGIDFASVHYKSGAEAMTAVISGQTQMAIDTMSAVRSLVEDGRLRALAVTAATRQPEMPDVPTMMEGGVRDYVVTSFFGFVAPAKTPPAAILRLHQEINASLKSPEVIAALAKLGTRPAADTLEGFGQLIGSELKKWTDISQNSGITLE